MQRAAICFESKSLNPGDPFWPHPLGFLAPLPPSQLHPWTLGLSRRSVRRREQDKPCSGGREWTMDFWEDWGIGYFLYSRAQRTVKSPWKTKPWKSCCVPAVTTHQGPCPASKKHIVWPSDCRQTHVSVRTPAAPCWVRTIGHVPCYELPEISPLRVAMNAHCFKSTYSSVQIASPTYWLMT